MKFNVLSAKLLRSVTLIVRKVCNIICEIYFVDIDLSRLMLKSLKICIQRTI